MLILVEVGYQLLQYSPLAAATLRSRLSQCNKGYGIAAYGSPWTVKLEGARPSVRLDGMATGSRGRSAVLGFGLYHSALFNAIEPGWL